jgi:hypothetical protein
LSQNWATLVVSDVILIYLRWSEGLRALGDGCRVSGLNALAVPLDALQFHLMLYRYAVTAALNRCRPHGASFSARLRGFAVAPVVLLASGLACYSKTAGNLWPADA